MPIKPNVTVIVTTTTAATATATATLDIVVVGLSKNINRTSVRYYFHGKLPFVC